MTASKQNYSRAETIPIDAIGLQFEMLPRRRMRSRPPWASMLRLLLRRGAVGQEAEKILESEPQVLFTTAPLMWFQPKDGPDRHPPSICARSTRPGSPRILATTGHSTNFILTSTCRRDVPPTTGSTGPSRLCH